MTTSETQPETQPRLVIGLGELLWDILPGGHRLGGAPANFAVMAGRLGDRAVIASRIGSDPLGEEALRILASLPIDCDSVQKDPALPTGTVTVAIVAGEPAYTIHQPVAWDRLDFSPAWQHLASSADAVCFGTLAQRDPVSRQTIRAFLDATRPTCLRIFDVNLRPPHWSPETLREGLARATILKLNGAELPAVLHGSGACPYPPESPREADLLDGARRLLERYPLRLVCITLGAHGSLLVSRGGRHRHPGLTVSVEDTVGSGDAFTAALAHYYLQGAPLPVLNEAGNRWGSWVASQPGAMPPLPPETAERLATEILGSP